MTEPASASASTALDPARTLRRLAWTCLLLMAVVTSASAWLRLAPVRPPCGQWPGCRVAQHEPGPAAASPALLAAVRGAHRLAASGVLLAAAALAVLAMRRRGARHIGAPAALLVALALALAALGVVTPGSRALGVVLGNLLGGLAMLALAWRVLRRLQQAGRPGGQVGSLAGAAAAVWLVQAGLGAASGAGLVADAPFLHVTLAWLALGLAGATGWAALAGPRAGEGRALMIVVLLQGLIGFAAAVHGAAPVLVWLHNVGAAAGLALLVGLLASSPVRPRS